MFNDADRCFPASPTCVESLRVTAVIDDENVFRRLNIEWTEAEYVVS